MQDIEQRLKELNISLPEVPAPGGVYTPAREFGENFVYMSGVGCNTLNGETFTGRAGAEVSIADAQRAAYQAALNAVAVMKANLGDLNRIKRIVKILGFVASADTFYEQPQVLNAASKLFCDIFGEEIGKGARSAIGVNVLPGNIPIEIEMLIELKENDRRISVN